MLAIIALREDYVVSILLLEQLQFLVVAEVQLKEKLDIWKVEGVFWDVCLIAVPQNLYVNVGGSLYYRNRWVWAGDYLNLQLIIYYLAQVITV